MAASFIWVRISCSSFAQGCYPHGAWRCVQKGWHKHSNYGNVLSFRFSICKAETSLLQDHNCWHTCTQCLSYCASETNTTARRSRSKKQNCATETLQSNYTPIKTKSHLAQSWYIIDSQVSVLFCSWKNLTCFSTHISLTVSWHLLKTQKYLRTLNFSFWP